MVHCEGAHPLCGAFWGMVTPIMPAYDPRRPNDRGPIAASALPTIGHAVLLRRTRRFFPSGGRDHLQCDCAYPLRDGQAEQRTGGQSHPR